METLFQDLKHALRSLERNGGFSLLVILILALGIGTSTAMFTLVNSVLLSPLEFRDAGQLVMVWERSHDGEERNPVSSANLFGWREQAESFSELAAFTMDYPFNLTGDGEPVVVQTKLTSENFFSLLGANAQLGRTYVEGGGVEVAVLSHALWQQRFGGDRAVIGRTIQLNGEALTVVGVMPADFRSIDTKPDLWTPIELTPEARGRFLRVVGRLRPGVSVESAQSEMRTVASALAEAHPEFNTNWSVNVVPMHEQVTGEIRPALLVLLGAVSLLLLIACANVANLLLGRAAAGRKDFAVRLSLGATRARLIRKALTESLLLAGISGALGLGLAVWGTAALARILPADLALPRLDEIGADLRVLVFALAVTLLTGVLFGIAPAIFGSAIDLSDGLRDSMRSTTSRSSRLRSGLVIAEVAIAVVLLVGAGLLARSLQRLLAVDPGLKTESVLTLRITMAGPGYEEEASLRNFMTSMLEKFEALPGVRSAGGTMWLPLSGAKSASSFYVEDRPKPREGEEPGADIRPIAGKYFSALGIPLHRGRLFDDRDNETAPTVFIVNDEMVRQHFPNEDPIGKRLSFWWGDMVSGEIIGVVGSVREMGPTEDPAPAIYRPYAQMPSSGMTMVLRASGDSLGIATAAAAAVREIDPNQPVAEIRSMDEILGGMMARPRLILYLLGGFAAAALLLAALGLYGIVSYSVAQRRREIGVRVALGAERRDVLRLIVGQGMRLTALGLTIGVAAALAATRLMASLLFGVGASDPLTIAGVAGFLALVSLTASWIPARRATRVDPVIALRNE